MSDLDADGESSRYQRAITIMIVATCTVVAAGVLSAGFRYWRFASCRGKVAAARSALAELGDEALRRDLAAHVTYLESRIERGWLYAKRDVFLGGLAREATGLLAAARGEVERPHLASGHHVIVTVSAVDGAGMPTSVSVPESWDGKSPLPVSLYFHHGGVTVMSQCFPAPELAGVLSVMPLARGSHDYLGVQMTAVEECLEDVRGRYPTLERLYLLGASQGGMGVWLYAQRHVGPRIAGLSPWCGNADPAGWEDFWEPPAAPGLSPAGRAAKMARAARAPVARVEQLVTSPRTPIWVGHGTDDTMIPFGHSRSMVEKLRAAGAGERLRFDEFQGLGHRNLPKMFMERIAWLAGRQGKSAPRAAALVIPPLTFVAEAPGAPPHRVKDPAAPARIDMSESGASWKENVEAWTGPGVSKLSYPGPAGAAFEGVFGLALPKVGRDHHVRCLDGFGRLWRERYGGEPRRVELGRSARFFAEKADAKMQRTLVAVGSPAENPETATALRGLDVSVEPGTVRIFGREFNGEDIGLIMLRPSAAVRGAGRLVIWGSTPESYRQLWSRFGQAVDWEGDRGRWWFDYAVFDRKTSGPETFLVVGFFDHRWEFDGGLLFEGSGELRGKATGTHWPSGGAVAVGLAPDERGAVWLSTIPPEAVKTSRGPVAFDRSAGVDAGPLRVAGAEHERGIGMVPPAFAEWRLGGRYGWLRVTVGLRRTGEKYPIRYEAERVVFEVLGDGKLLAASNEMSSTSGTAELDVDLSGVDVLELRASCATRHVWHYGPVGWADARLYRAAGGGEQR